MSSKSNFWARVGLCSEVFVIAVTFITGWFVFFGDDQLLSLFLLPGFMFGFALSVFAVVSRGALRMLRARLAVL